MRERLERPARPRRRGRSGSSRSTPPAAGSCAREAPRLGLPLELHDLRPGRPGAARQAAASRSSSATRSASCRAASTRRSRTRRTQLVGPDEYAARVAIVLRPDGRRRLRARTSAGCFASNAVDFDDLLMLTVDVLERFPEARERWQKAFRYVLVDEYQDTNHAQYRLLQLLAGEHRNLCVVGDPDQSIYGFRGADIRNILDFEQDFPGTRAIALEQNYRSTNTILARRERRHRQQPRAQGEELWSELGEGDAGAASLEVEDEHAEARFVAAEIAAARRGRLHRLPRSRSSTGRTRSSRVLEDVLVRQGVAYQVIGGPRFYERAEIKDAIAYLQVIDNPSDAVSLMRIANRPRRGIGDTSLARLATYATRKGSSLFEALGRAEAAGARRRRRCARAQRSGRCCSRCSRRAGLSVSELVERMLERTGYLEALEAERTIEARGRIENLQELVGVAQEYLEPAPKSRRCRRSCRRSRSTPTRMRCADERSARHADDAPQREGPRVPRRVHDRHGGGDLPALTLDRGAGRRGGAAPRVRRDDACEGAADAHARDDAVAVRAAARTTCRRGSSTSCRGGRRARAAAAASWATTARDGDRAARRRCRRSSTGDSVRHATLGEGVVLRIEAGGVVTVRFAEDGAERRLMLEYAPLEKIA